MIRTVKQSKVTILHNQNGELVESTIIVVCNNDKELKTELNKKYGRATGSYIIKNIVQGEVVYEMDDKFFFDNAKKISDTFAE